MRISKLINPLLIFGVGLILGVVSSSFFFQRTIDKRIQDLENSFQREEKEITASLMIDFSDGRIIVCNNQKLAQDQSVFDLLKICSQNSKNPFELKYEIHPEWGAFVKRIGDKENGQEGKYWQYWVNNEYAKVGASSFRLKNGDIVEWKFIKSQF